MCGGLWSSTTSQNYDKSPGSQSSASHGIAQDERVGVVVEEDHEAQPLLARLGPRRNFQLGLSIRTDSGSLASSPCSCSKKMKDTAG